MGQIIFDEALPHSLLPTDVSQLRQSQTRRSKSVGRSEEEEKDLPFEVALEGGEREALKLIRKHLAGMMQLFLLFPKSYSVKRGRMWSAVPHRTRKHPFPY